MSQQSDEYSFLVTRLLDLLTEQYGFREHWEVTITNNINAGNVSVGLTLRQTPGRHRYGDMQVGFWIANYMFTEFTIIRGRLLEAANGIVNDLQYRNRQDSHPPQVKIYCWLEESSLESQEPPIHQGSPETPIFNFDGIYQAEVLYLIQTMMDKILELQFPHSRLNRQCEISGGSVWIFEPGYGQPIHGFPTIQALRSYVASIEPERRVTVPLNSQGMTPVSHIRRVEL